MSKNRTDKKRERRLDAESRAISYAELSTKEKLERLPSDGAKNQRKRLLKIAVVNSGILPAMIVAVATQFV